MFKYQFQNQNQDSDIFTPKLYGRKTSDSWVDEEQERDSWEEQFPNFRFLKQLSCTQSSSVWMIESCQDSKIYAGKIVPKIQNGDQENNHRKEELRFLKQANLKNTVKTQQIHSSADFYLILMKYFKQGDLASYCQKQNKNVMLKFPEQHLKWVKFCFKQIIKSVNELHENGYIHRDLKPSNFLITDNYTLRLNDFGLVIKENQIDNSFCGTLAYMAPERLDTKKSSIPISKSSDMWSLGIILYELTTGQVPFEQADRQQMLQSIYSNFISIGQNIPQDLRDVMLKLLQINPLNRMSMHQLKNHSYLKNE